ncbi:MAG: hypothetical protein MPN21_24485 [Thermoanaerobaculia bacterium]|nr:hypothetical protein [Thermoanaerobaculia bacterium]
MICQRNVRVSRWIGFTLPLLLWAPPAVAAGDGRDLLLDHGRASAQRPLGDDPVRRGSASTLLEFEDHDYVNPFTGGVAWETSQNADVLAMEWAFVGVSEVLPVCSGPFDWTIVDMFLARVASRGHQAILRPVFFGPGYGLENFAPDDLSVADFIYDGETYDNPRWDLPATQSCVLQFIDAFAARYENDLRIAYVQMGLAGLWGEHHLDGASYTAANFPSIAFQKTMISHYLEGFGSTSSDLLSSLSLDSSQSHGFFGSDDTSFDAERVGFFDDSLLIANHGAPGNWRQQPHPAEQLLLHSRHGWGGEAFWDPCNKDSLWIVSPHDCGNGESLGAQAGRIGLSYMLGSPAFHDSSVSSVDLLTASQMMGYKFTATDAVRQDAGHVAVVVENTGAAYCPYRVQVCTEQGCAGDLSALAPGNDMVVSVPASASEMQVLFLTSPRLDLASQQKIRWSNVGADGAASTLTVTVDAVEEIFVDGFESGTTEAWTTSTP